MSETVCEKGIWDSGWMTGIREGRQGCKDLLEAAKGLQAARAELALFRIGVRLRGAARAARGKALLRALREASVTLDAVIARAEGQS